MKKTLKVASLVALAGLGVASLGSCGKKTTVAPAKASGDIDVSILYKGTVKSGVSYQGDNKTLVTGDALNKNELTPTWKCFGEKLTAKYGERVAIRDANDYSSKEFKDDWKNYGTKGYKFGENMIDLVMGDSKVFTTAANASQLQSIDEYLDKMPSFNEWKKGHEAIWNSMVHTDGKHYFTPYFDGLDEIEEMQIMNTKYVQKLLDSAEGYDTEKVLTSAYQPTVKETAAQEVTVGTGTSAQIGKKTVSVKITAANNPVAKQNALETKNGAELVKALKEALIAEYGDNLAKSAGGKAEDNVAVWKKLSDLFTGVSATYTVDDMVALLRCVKTNPKFLTGNAAAEMSPIVPRTAENKRTIKLDSLIAWWGHKGMDSENSKLYFDEAGELQDARTQKGTYDGLDELHKLYQEGLFAKNFVQDSKGTNMGKTEYRSALMQNGTAFMLYDYNATSSLYNQDVAKAEGSNPDFNYQPVLAPIVKWTEKDLQFKGTNLKGKYFRFSESNRSLKSGGWAIPSTSDNKESAIALMDYLFSTEGARIQDFGPDNGKYWQLGTLPGFGEVPVIDSKLLNDVNTNGKYTWNDYYRIYIGSTQGIGHIRSGALDYQVTLGDSAKAGIANVKAAINEDIEILAKTSVANNTSKFFLSVPTNIPLNANQEADANDPSVTPFTTLWASDSTDAICPACNYIIVGESALNVTNGFQSKQALIAGSKDCDYHYLRNYRDAVVLVL